MNAALAKVRDILGQAMAEVDAALDGNATTEAGFLPDTDDGYPRGTVIWFRRASRSDDRIPAVIVRHGKGWSMNGRTGYLSWADLQREFFNEPLSWYSVQDAEGMGVNVAS